MACPPVVFRAWHEPTIRAKLPAPRFVHSFGQGGPFLEEPREADLIARLRRRDTEALGDLYRWLGADMLTLARSLLRSREEADDAVEESLLRIHRGAPGFRGERGLRTWSLRIVSNLCRDRLRRRRFSAGPPEDLDPLAHARLVVNPIGDWDAQMDQRALLVELERAIAALPADQREAIVLRDRIGLSYEEAAASLGISVAAVKSRLFRARERLKASLRPWIEERGT